MNTIQDQAKFHQSVNISARIVVLPLILTLSLFVLKASLFGGTIDIVSRSFANGDNSIYQVPAGKVLLVDALCIAAASGTIQVYLGGGIIAGSGGPQTWSFSRPVKLAAEQSIRAKSWDGNSTSSFSFWGTLIDAQDLYVGIPSRIDEFSVAGGTATTRVSFASPQPALVQLEKSPDLKMWSGVADAFVANKGNQTNLVLVSSTAADTNAFLRVRTIPR